MKYRGIIQDKETKKESFVYGHYVYNEEDNCHSIIDDEMNIIEVIFKPDMCLGFRDISGKMVYVNDYVEVSANIGKKGEKYVVEYFEKYCMFGLLLNALDSKPLGHGGSSTRYSPYILSEYYQKRIKVHGNIHFIHE